jgi:4-amino-4-deoxy-L-arabinose transferase-like glycosyltransferase
MGSRDALTAPFAATRAGRLCGLLAFAKLALLVPILERYGWDRDELYFLAAGRHLAFGYVDFPPLVAVAARAVDATAGPSLITLRLLSSLLAAVAAVAVGAIARELGAGPRLQVLACAAWIVTPFGLGGAVLIHPTFLELAATALALLAATRLVVRAELRQWLPLGLWAGLGLESKYTIVVPLAAFLAGCALWRRDLLLRREAALGTAIAVALVIPNIAWEVTHHWISLDFASSQHAATASDSPPLVYAGQVLAFLGAGAVLAAIGIVWLWRRPRLRPLALASGAPLVLFGLEQGRSYYALPALLPALAAGCIALAERRPRRATLAGLGVVHVAVLALALPLVVPVLPVRQLVSTGTWDR